MLWGDKDKTITQPTLVCTSGCKNNLFYYVDLVKLYHTETMKLLIYDTFVPEDNCRKDLVLAQQKIAAHYNQFRCNECNSIVFAKSLTRERR